MAIVPLGWFLHTEWVDTGNNKTSRDFDLVATDTADDAAAVFTDVAAILAAYIAASDAVMTNYSVGKRFAEGSVTLPAAAEVENNLQVSAKIAGIPNKSAVFEIPAPKVTLFQATTGVGYNQADFADTLLSAVVALYTVAGNKAYISDGEQITVQGIKGKRVHHKSNKG